MKSQPFPLTAADRVLLVSLTVIAVVSISGLMGAAQWPDAAERSHQYVMDTQEMGR